MKRTEQTDDGPRLAGGRCGNCGHTMIPLRSVCPACRESRVEPASLGPRASVVRWADLQVGAAGIEPPYHVGLIRLREGPTVFARIQGQPSIGLDVRLAVSDQDTYWFETDADQREG